MNKKGNRKLELGLLASFFLFFFLWFTQVRASELTFKFTIPSLGGDPLMGGYYLQQAQLQNKFKEEKKPLFQPKSLLDRFTESLTSQLLYRMADTLLDQIFGNDGTINPGSYKIGNFQINLTEEQRDGTSYYIFEITDTSTGQTTVLELPKVI